MKNISLVIAGLFLAGVSQAMPRGVIRESARMPVYQILTPGDEADFIEGCAAPARPVRPHRDDVIGEQFQAGDTWHDYQTNGTVGKMIAVDNAGGIHVTWMDAYTSAIVTGTRHQKYNYYADGAWYEQDGVQAAQSTKSGFGSICLSSEEEDRAVVFCHATGILEGADPISLVSIDFGRGYGAFEQFMVPNYPEQRIFWPQGVISPAGRIHVVCNRTGASMISYSGTDFNEGQPEFPEIPIEISETSLNTYRIARSPNSERVAIAWVSVVSRIGIPAPAEWEGSGFYQMNNDLRLVWTDDGETWNFDNPLNVTNTIPPNPEVEGDESFGDTLRPFVTYDLAFDENDNIHIVFDSRGFYEKAIYDPETEDPWVGATSDYSYLFHWTEEDCTFSAVADGWYSQDIYDENDTLFLEPILQPRPGAWKSNVCQPSIAFAADGDLYCTFNIYPREDYNNWVTDANGNFPGRCNGNVAVTVSEDNGETWFYPTILTDTPSPMAEPGQALCEMYPTLAERVDDNLHVFYELDGEAGSDINDDNTTNTPNPMYYLRVPTDEVLRDSVWDGPNWHVGEQEESVDSEPEFTPAGFRLAGAHPNPFNATSHIEFDLEVRQIIELAVFGTDGRRVATLFNGEALPGHHRVTLDGARLAAGVFLVRLTGGASTAAIKVALLK